MDIEFITTNWYLFAALVVICALIAVDTFRRGANTNQVTAVQLPQLINHDGAVVIDQLRQLYGSNLVCVSTTSERVYSDQGADDHKRGKQIPVSGDEFNVHGVKY